MVERLDQLLARRTGRRSAARTPTRAAARRRSSGSRAARRATPRRRRRRRSRCRRARRSARPARSGRPRRRAPSAGSARLPTITGWTNSTATWRASERAAGDRAEREQPPAAREALGHRVAEPREPLGLGARRSAVGLGALGEQRVDGRASRRRVTPARPPLAGSATSQSRNASTPSPVRALTSMRCDARDDRVEVVQEVLEVEVEVRRAGRSC